MGPWRGQGAGRRSPQASAASPNGSRGSAMAGKKKPQPSRRRLPNWRRNSLDFWPLFLYRFGCCPQSCPQNGLATVRRVFPPAAAAASHLGPATPPNPAPRWASCSVASRSKVAHCIPLGLGPCPLAAPRGPAQPPPDGLDSPPGPGLVSLSLALVRQPPAVPTGRKRPPPRDTAGPRAARTLGTGTRAANPPQPQGVCTRSTGHSTVRLSPSPIWNR